jgi:DNA helicase II / ATP-dependent DNA helicase PcrA
MSKWNEKIDGNHLKIAAHQGSTMRVVAGPGTGKSYALQRKVMRLIEEGINPERILAVTFTNVAADALKKDMTGLEIDGSENVKACTLHSICFEILIDEKVLEFTGRYPRPLLDFEQNFLLEDLMNYYGGKKKTKKLLKAYESAFAREQDDIPNVISSEVDADFKDRLLRWLKIHKSMLIGELIPITFDYLKNNPAAPEFDKYDYVLVDEYQDLNKAEQSLIDLLAKKSELLIVGDEDQSIYSFKHAHPEGITEFHTTHTPLEDIGLNVCRRCPKKVVRLANELMGYFLGSHPKKLDEFEENEEGNIYAVQWDTLALETEGVSKIIKKLVTDQQFEVKPEDILVLSPRRKLAYALRDKLGNDYAIASHSFFQEEALDTTKAQKSFSMLSYLVNPNDRVSFRALLGLPTGLTGSYEKVLVKAVELSLTPKNVVEKVADGSLLIPGINPLIQRFREFEQLRAELEDKTLPEIINILFDPNTPEDIEELLSLISTFTIDDETDKLKFFTRLQDRVRTPEVTDEGGYIRLMSLHKSKGLTSKVVFILGCVAGLIPTIKDEDDLIDTNQTEELTKLRDEAKRLFFVAITRSKKFLFLSSFKQIEYALAMSLGGVKLISQKGSKIAQTQASPFYSEVARHLPTVNTGDELLKEFNIED